MLREISEEELCMVIHRHALWLAGNGGAQADLSNCDMQGMDLFFVDLTNAKVSGANFEGANLSNSVFSRANFYGANFRNADLNCCIFNGAYLTDCTMRGAILDYKIQVVDTPTFSVAKHFNKSIKRYKTDEFPLIGRDCYAVACINSKSGAPVPDVYIFCGCWKGTISEFEAACEDRYPHNPARAYAAEIAELRTHFSNHLNPDK